MTRDERIAELARTRPRSRALRASIAALVLLVIGSWASGEVAVGDLFSARRAANLERFLERDARPAPLREPGGSWTDVFAWAREAVARRDAGGLLATLEISVLAIVLAALLAALLVPLGARTLMAAEPYLVGPPRRRAAWRLLTGLTRFALIVLRAVPEYVWAFLLLAVLGPSAWPAVLALALHNAGILGRLGADTVENLDVAPLRALRVAGASRRQIAALAIVPLTLPRMLLYFFYRLETCVREATVLGMLGVVSLGYWIQDARARHVYDEMLLLVLLGAVVVLLGDLTSHLARGWVRRAS